jgi:hypothetical protein
MVLYKMINTFCYNDRAKVQDPNDFALLLSVIAGECASEGGVAVEKAPARKAEQKE